MNLFIARATAISNGDFFQVITQTTGMLAYAEPSVQPVTVSSDASDKELGHALREALKNSKQVPLQTFQEIWRSGRVEVKEEERVALLMEQFGYRNERALYKNMDTCSVVAKDGYIEIQPTHKNNPGTYTVSKNTGPFAFQVPDTVSDEELGAALRKGFSLCTR